MFTELIKKDRYCLYSNQITRTICETSKYDIRNCIKEINDLKDNRNQPNHFCEIDKINRIETRKI